MLRYIAIALALACAGCAASAHALPETSSSDPVWQLNPGKWLASTNDLVAPPVTQAVAQQ